MTTNNTPKANLLSHKLNQETGKINWTELQRYFARGVLIVAAKELDLVEVADQISKDQDKIIKSYLESNKMYHATDDDAIRWQDKNQSFWAIVIAPWVLVQEI